MAAHLKPNGQSFGTFLISIDDGYVEYTYPIKLGDGVQATCIAGVYKRICDALNADVCEGHMRPRYQLDKPRKRRTNGK